MVEIESKQEILSPAQRKLQELIEAKKNAPNALALIKDRIMILSDVSSSMAVTFGHHHDSRAKAAKLAMDAIIQASDLRTVQYGLITFNHEPYLIHPMGSGTAKFLSTEFIPSGGTRLTPALELALPQKPNRVIALTDGEIDFYDAKAFATNNYVPKSIKIDTIAIGEANSAYLRELSEITGGKFQQASTPEELQEVFRQLEPRNYLLLEHKS